MQQLGFGQSSSPCVLAASNRPALSAPQTHSYSLLEDARLCLSCLLLGGERGGHPGTGYLRCPGGGVSQKNERGLLPPCILSASSFRLLIAHLTPPMATEKMVAEYAKSGRSSTLRLGLTSKDTRGFEMVKWHHLDCLPTPRSFAAVEEIKGYYSLKSTDREALKNFETMAAAKHSVDTEEDEEMIMKKSKHGDGEKEGEEMVFSITDIKTEYKVMLLPPEWKAFQTVIFREAGDGLRDSEKIAAFDFDGCLVRTSLKRIGPNEWSLLYPSIPEKLRNLLTLLGIDSGFSFEVIFTNESNIERWKNKRQLAVDSKIGRLENFMKRVEVPMQIFIACGLGKGKDQPQDPFRKPNPGLWRLLEKHFNSKIAVDMDKSFYVGDAAGRGDDHSDADIEFAKVRMMFSGPLFTGSFPT
ncbi:unnamed protein product [Spirodela intermedia]|uniref:PARP-type domain-containing protein n=1 Tax=Spirodela intermedia TaxID=51605 RepID=A0A7I8J928_SPIIN|nr:unnamed protein product [Spirodela intermedia]CAA6665933.1 unnamed protein product [Spirodela intermedia]